MIFRILTPFSKPFFLLSCPTDPSVISSCVPGATTNTPPGNHFEWTDYRECVP